MTEKVHNKNQMHAFIHQIKKTKPNKIIFNLKRNSLPYKGMIKEKVLDLLKKKKQNKKPTKPTDILSQLFT